MNDEKSPLEQENQELKEKLAEARATLEAIRKGEVDAIVVQGPKGELLYSLMSPDHPYQIFFDRMKEAAVILNTEGKILYANPSFFGMINRPSDTTIGTLIFDYMRQEVSKDLFVNLIEKKTKKWESQLLTSDGKELIISLSANRGVWKDSDSICLVISDITELKRAEKFITVSQAVTSILSEAPDLSYALKQILKILNQALGWEVIVFSEWIEEKQSLKCIEVVHIPEIEISEFEKKSKEMEVGKAPLLTHVWYSYRPYSIEDVSEDSTFLRRQEALEGNLKGALAFPVYSNTSLGGVVELYRRTPFREELDEFLLNFMTSIGIEIGQFIHRKKIEKIKFQFSAIVMASCEGIYSFDRSGIIGSWNIGAEKIFGWNSSEMIGNSEKKLYPEQIMNEFEEIQSAILSGNAIESRKSQRIRKDGKKIWIDSSYGPIKDETGRVIGASIIIRDITQERDKFLTLVESEGRLNNFLEVTKEWNWEIDTKGSFTFTNRLSEPLLGYPTEEIVGKSFLYFLPAEERVIAENLLKNSIREKKGWKNQIFRTFHKLGDLRWIDTNAVPYFDSQNNVLGFRGSSSDITEKMNLERLKNEFISTVGHELRTPLTSIHASLSLLNSKETSPEEQKKLIQLAHRNSDRMTKIINDILDIEKLRLGKMEFSFKKLNLLDIVTEGIQLSKNSAHSFGIEILTKDPLASPTVLGDKDRLLQVIIELLTNAIKFSPNNTKIFVSLEEIDGKAKLSVHDQGKGIPKEFQSKIFEKFFQVDSSSIRLYPGTGLGLSICKSIIEAHRGIIDFKSEAGKGAVFYFEIPTTKE